MYASVTFEGQDSVSKVTESSCVVIKGKEVHLEVSSYIVTLYKRWENIGSGNLTNLSCFIVSFRKCMLYFVERCHQVNTSKPPVNLAEMRKLNALLAQHPEQAVFIKGIDAQTSHDNIKEFFSQYGTVVGVIQREDRQKVNEYNYAHVREALRRRNANSFIVLTCDGKVCACFVYNRHVLTAGRVPLRAV